MGFQVRLGCACCGRQLGEGHVSLRVLGQVVQRQFHPYRAGLLHVVSGQRQDVQKEPEKKILNARFGKLLWRMRNGRCEKALEGSDKKVTIVKLMVRQVFERFDEQASGMGCQAEKRAVSGWTQELDPVEAAAALRLFVCAVNLAGAGDDHVTGSEMKTAVINHISLGASLQQTDLEGILMKVLPQGGMSVGVDIASDQRNFGNPVAGEVQHRTVGRRHIGFHRAMLPFFYVLSSRPMFLKSYVRFETYLSLKCAIIHTMKRKETIQSYSHSGEGFRPLVVSSGWQVSQLNDRSDLHADTIRQVERHDATDEVFILMKGDATLVICTECDGALVPETLHMEPGVTYNIPRGVWHTIMTAPGMQVMIVEKDDTHKNDVTHRLLTASECQVLQKC